MTETIKLIETNGKHLFFVEVPAGAINFRLEKYLIPNALMYQLPTHTGVLNLPSGQYQILGKSTELSNPQIEDICERMSPYPGLVIFFYMNYLTGKFDFDIVQESYLSLLQANGVVDRNQYGDVCPKPVTLSEDDDFGLMSTLRFHKIGQWQEVQSKVKHYLILIKR